MYIIDMIDILTRKISHHLAVTNNDISDNKFVIELQIHIIVRLAQFKTNLSA